MNAAPRPLHDDLTPPGAMEVAVWWAVWLGAVAHAVGAVESARRLGGLDTLALIVAVALPAAVLRALRARRALRRAAREGAGPYR
jgi:hypothetical protein